MEFVDFSRQLALWCESDQVRPLDCWVDDIPLEFTKIDTGVRCSIELLDQSDSADLRCLEACLKLGGASLACESPSAMGLDPETRCVSLVRWLPGPFDQDDLMACASQLVNQRAALVSLLEAPQLRAARPSVLPTSLSVWQRNILDA